VIKYPKQIIYPINFLKPSLYFSKKNFLNNFLKRFKKINRNNSLNQKILGRARSGFYIAIKSLIKNERNVFLISPFTIHEVIDLIILAGGKPLFIDFQKETTNLDLEKIKKNINKNVCGLVITHYSIVDKNINMIFQLSKEKKIAIIEDCALSYSSAYNISKKNRSDFQIYSFSSFKTINYFYGGLISYQKKYEEKVSNITKNWKKLSFLSYLRQIIRTSIFVFLTNNLIYNFLTIHILRKKNTIKNFLEKKIDIKTTEINSSYFSVPSNAAVNELNFKISNYNKIVIHRRKISLNYYSFLKNISIPKQITTKDIIQSDCFNYLILCKSENHKNFLNNILIENNFDTGLHFYYNCKNFKKFANIYGKTSNLDNLIKRLLILPTHPRISIKYSTTLSQAILKYYG
jgi:dTDP-4-amino-4,6-dideoxygalactose transaminase